MEYPPSKRLKGMASATPSNDTFGDDDDFTQDDLEEIDIIASQAVTGIQAEPGQTSKGTPVGMGSFGPRQGELRTSYSGGRQQPCGLAKSNPAREREIPEFPCNNTFGNGQHSKVDREYFQQLEAQQADLKKKLKEVEDEILMKNGEIRVLRDSIRVAQQEKETQRQAQLLLEKERRDAQTEKEKELAKKVQSLQSELYFKEAEMNEMKTKLQNSERGSKAVASPVSRNSPRQSGMKALLQGVGPSQAGPSTLIHRTSSPQPLTSPGGTAFITKEMFGAQLPSRSTPSKISGPGLLRNDGKQASSSKQEVTRSDPFNTFQPSQHQGLVLLSLLLQHPLDPSLLGLSHLLCISPDALPGLLTNICLSSGLSPDSSSSLTELKAPSHLCNKPHSQQPRFSHYQSLALSGLNMMALPCSAHNPNTPLPNPQALPHTDTSPTLANSPRSCPAAVHLLPLLDHHVGLFCQSLEAVALDGSGKSTLTGGSLCGSGSLDGSLASSVEDSLGSQEEFALAALTALRHALAHSFEVVHTLLDWQPPPEGSAPQGNARSRPILAAGLTPFPPGTSAQPSTSKVSSTLPDRTRAGLHHLHPLLQKLLHLSDPVCSTRAVQREVVVSSSLSALVMLLKKAQPSQLSSRFRCVISGPVLSRCLSLTSSYQVMSLSVSLLDVLAHSDELAATLCSHTDSCVFLKVFQYITSRPDKSVIDIQWANLEVKAIRLVARLWTSKASRWGVFGESSCQCRGEVVQTLVVLLHRQWLDLRGRAEAGAGGNNKTPSPAWYIAPGVDLLREALVLLHWLFVNHSSFSDHCLPVLHLFDQMIPAVRDTLRKIPDLSEMEELALEEICRGEAEDTDDMDIDTGS
ncbi:hypothetical protein UPYG_G00092080 [Umbra pygmaea]|uniref:ATR-interacting protein n=1 Tax=Umbra pygmaea TaxID=75934 RepID=A0ABD0XIM3_UMBPY